MIGDRDSTIVSRNVTVEILGTTVLCSLRVSSQRADPIVYAVWENDATEDFCSIVSPIRWAGESGRLVQLVEHGKGPGSWCATSVVITAVMGTVLHP